MKILGIESAGKVASVALVEDNIIKCDFTINGQYTHSKTIMPMIKAMGDIMDVSFDAIDGIAVSSGPGSYTGLRIGSSTAKALAHAWQVPIVGVSTLESLANNIDVTDALICPMLDARRQHAFSAAYHYVEGQLVNVIPIDLRSVEEFVGLLLPMNKPMIFMGDGLTNHRGLVENFVPADQWSEARPIDCLPKASTLALIGCQRLSEGISDSYMDHQPNYYRPSQAERELKKK